MGACDGESYHTARKETDNILAKNPDLSHYFSRPAATIRHQGFFQLPIHQLLITNTPTTCLPGAAALPEAV
jgi:hypothetical protein